MSIGSTVHRKEPLGRAVREIGISSSLAVHDGQAAAVGGTSTLGGGCLCLQSAPAVSENQRRDRQGSIAHRGIMLEDASSCDHGTDRARSPGVSVVIPAYNASATIGACIRSVLAADYDGRVEVIVADDGSTDDTAAIAERMGCRLVRKTRNGGPARARNAGAGAARGDILIFVDADTQMRRDSIQEAVRALSQNGVGAVSGMYEPEPINSGFFPRYYAYLKYQAYTANDADRINVFSGQCGAIWKELFDRLGGYRSIAWGVDIENEEFGYRINQENEVALSRRFRVGHNFPGFAKLMFVFNNRVYWWILFRHFSKRDETVLMTRGFGYATAALPASALCLSAAPFMPGRILPAILYTLSLMLGCGFAWGYKGFWRFCLGRGGPVFALVSALASALFSFVITAGAARGYLSVAWKTLRGRELPFTRSALGRT